MKIQTHLQISPTLVGEVVEIAENSAVARLTSTPEMCADDRGLVHGGFAFGLADYAAMVAVNDPNVVLGKAETTFIAPVRCGEVMTAKAALIEQKGKKRIVEVTVETDRKVFEGVFTCFVLDKHVFDMA